MFPISVEMRRHGREVFGSVSEQNPQGQTVPHLLVAAQQGTLQAPGGGGGMRVAQWELCPEPTEALGDARHSPPALHLVLVAEPEWGVHKARQRTAAGTE